MEKNDIIICENCYEENESSRTTCKNCGAKLYKRKIIKDNENDEQEEIYEEKNASFFNITKGNNNVATVVKIIGWIEIVCGVILGIILGNTYELGYYRTEFNGGLCLGIIIAGIIIGTFIIGFGEIIQKLQNIENNTKN